MGRTKIEVNISSVKSRGNRAMNIIIGSTTTAKDVLSKVLEKCRVSDPLEKYQLWAVAKDNSQQGLLSHDHNCECECVCTLSDFHAIPNYSVLHTRKNVRFRKWPGNEASLHAHTHTHTQTNTHTHTHTDKYTHTHTHTHYGLDSGDQSLMAL